MFKQVAVTFASVARLCAPLLAVLAGASITVASLAPASTVAHASHADLAAQTAAAASAPSCQRPSTLASSASLAEGLETVSPMPDSTTAPTETQISFLGQPASDLFAVHVSGSVSGEHTGTLEPYSEGDGASFVPTAPFTPGETVTVAAELQHEGRTIAFSWSFTVGTPIAQRAPTSHHRAHEARLEVQHFHSAPQLRPPTITATRSPGAALAPGYLLTSPEQPPIQSGPMMFDDSGQVVWFDPIAPGGQVVDVQRQTYQGQPVITYWEHLPRPNGSFISRDVILNQHYRPVAYVEAGNELGTDTHDFQLTPSGTALLIADQELACNLSSIGGKSSGAVLDGVMQEIDVKTGLVMFQWDSLDHVALSESYVSASSATSERPFDYFHFNSINLNRDGSLMISSRNTWTVYDLSASTGQILWRFGGKHSSFQMGPGTTPAFQHDARQGPGDEISVFDNGGVPRVHEQSSGLIVHLDMGNHTATLVRVLDHSPSILSGSQGDVQELPDGNDLVGWGQSSEASEYAADGKLLLNTSLPPGEQAYRTLRYRWDGQPLTKPAIAVSSPSQGKVTVWASWNGATQVTAWRVLEGPAGEPRRAVATVQKSGFETAVPVAAPAAGVQLAAQALGANGRVLGISKQVG